MDNSKQNTGVILTLAYPDTIVSHAEEWYSSLLKYIGIGNKTSVRAGHAALVLINKNTGVLEYHDFGRYITPRPNGRVRGSDTDGELSIPFKAQFNNGEIANLNAILKFLATHPKLTHGDGKLLASVCDVVNYEEARKHITNQQNRGFIRYAAFVKSGCNCARFVTEALIASVTDAAMVKKLKHSKWFTPSTVGNVVLANTNPFPFEVSETGEISEFSGSQKSENLRCFLDKLKGYQPNFVGTLQPKTVSGLHEKAQWLPGIAAGAWFELFETSKASEYRYRRISPYGNIDVDAVFSIKESGFNYKDAYQIVHYSNCKFFHIKQGEAIFRFDKIEN
ncbi:DUF6695 family protein [Lacinutrix salivirga]